MKGKHSLQERAYANEDKYSREDDQYVTESDESDEESDSDIDDNDRKRKNKNKNKNKNKRNNRSRRSGNGMVNASQSNMNKWSGAGGEYDEFGDEYDEFSPVLGSRIKNKAKQGSRGSSSYTRRIDNNNCNVKFWCL